jgi:hypothetical protein
VNRPRTVTPAETRHKSLIDKLFAGNRRVTIGRRSIPPKIYNSASTAATCCEIEVGSKFATDSHQVRQRRAAGEGQVFRDVATGGKTDRAQLLLSTLEVAWPSSSGS